MPRFVIAIVLALLVLAGCGGAADPTAAPTREARATATSGPAADEGTEDEEDEEDEEDTGGSDAPGSGDDGEIEGVEFFKDELSQDHAEGAVKYDQVPPLGGPHNPRWQNCGIYDKPVRNEHAVHSLEHGAVWITYQPDLDDEDVEVLRELARGHSHVLVSPYPGLPEPVVISAWGIQLKVDSAEDPRLPRFIEAYEEGPQNPEPGAPCSGGVGTPIRAL